MKLYTLILSLLPLCAHAANDSISARVETEATFSGGDYAPLWLSTNKYGMGSAESNSFYLRAGADWKRYFRRGWKIGAGLDLAGGAGTVSKFWVLRENTCLHPQ